MSTPARRLAVIVFTDIAGYTALMQKDEEKALQVLETNRSLHKNLILHHGGKWLKEIGDGVLASFESTTDALNFSHALINQARDENIGLRVGLHVGEVVFREGDVYGDGVNIASRMEALAIPGSVVFTERVYEDIRNKSGFRAVHLGAHAVKNVDKPLEVYALEAEGLTIPGQSGDPKGSPQIQGTKGWFAKGSSIYTIVVVCIILAFVAWKYLIPGPEQNQSPTAVETEDSLNALAALPFSNISQNPEIDYMGFALADQVINALSYLQNIVVRPSSSIRKYESQEVDPLDVADDLKVQFVLMGHYLTHGDSVRLNLELIDINGNKVIWRGSVQEESSDIFRLQDRVAEQVIDGLEIQFSGAERTRMNRDIPKDPLAYEYYLKALAYPGNVEGNQLAINMLKRSIELDSTFAPAFSELGNRLHMAARYTIIENQSVEIEKARKMLEHALELNGELLEALGNLSLLLTELSEMESALGLARRMVALNPNSALGHFAIGYVYRYLGLLDQAVEEMRAAVRLDPQDEAFRSAGVTYTMAGRYEEAIDALYFEDGSGFSESWRGVTYLKMGQHENAKVEFEKAWNKDPNSILAKWCEGFLAYLEGIEPDWAELSIIEEGVEDPESIYFWSYINVIHGDQEGFFQLFEKAINNGYYPYPAFEIDPFLDPVREHPRFIEAMETARIKHLEFKESISEMQ